MATSQDKVSGPTPLGVTTYALIGLAVGSITWNNAVVIAKLHRWLLNKPLDDEKRIVEAALIIIVAFTFMGILFARRGVKRGSAEATQVVWLMVAAIITASFAIIDHALPNPVDNSKLPLLRTFYLLGWMVGLCLIAPLAAPFLLLRRQPANRSLYSVDLMAMLATLALFSFFASETLIVIADRFFDFSRGRWLLNPSSLNAIASCTVVVTLLPIWRQELYSNKRSMSAILWIVFFVAFVIIYAGMYGPWFKRLNVSRWQLFCAYASFPTAAMIAAFIAFLIPVRLRRFRWFVPPVGLATIFAAMAKYRLAPLTLDEQGNFSLIVAHAVNGILLGLIIAFWRESKWWWGGSYISEE